MVFSSTIFMFLFLPIVLCVYLLISAAAQLRRSPTGLHQAKNLWLLVASLVFYAWGEPVLIVVMLASAVVDYSCGLGMAGTLPWKSDPKPLIPGSPRTARQKAWLLASLIFGIGLLSIFKYSAFAIDNYNGLLTVFGLASLQWKNPPHLALPLGISFYTFQSMSYTIDVYRGKAKPTRSILDYLCFVTLFPQLIAGPIVRYVNVAAELVQRHVTAAQLEYGIYRFMSGLAKKVLIANTLAGPVDQIFAAPISQVSPGIAWLGIIGYTLQIYFDFSGYSDMAIGLGRMFGFTFMENFDYPYIAGSITEFWRRWHISLSTWFRDYLYIPLGGNRQGTLTTYRNLVFVFLVCGLWHGANWTFVVWGIGHGTLLVLERVGFSKILARIWTPVRHLYALVAIMGMWVIFRSDSISSAGAYLRALTNLGFYREPPPLIWVTLDTYLTRDVATALLVATVFATPLPTRALAIIAARLRPWTKEGTVARAALSVGAFGVLIVVFVLCMARLSAGTYNPFIYFRF